jgi:hypothetical protein
VVAEQMAVEVHGSLGVLLWGAATGLVDFRQQKRHWTAYANRLFGSRRGF